MAANQKALADRPVNYHPFAETRPGQGRGLLAALAGQACCVVADQFPCFFIPRMLAAAARKIDVLMEAVDSCGLVALARPGREFARAYDFRRFLQRGLAEELAAWPQEDPLKTLPQGKPVGLPEEVLKRWPAAPSSLLRAEPGALSALPIDQEVGEVAARRGGQEAAKKTLKAFLGNRPGALRRPGPASRSRGGQQPLALSPLRPHLGPPGLSGPGRSRGLVALPPAPKPPGRQGRLAGPEPFGRGLFGSASDLARAGLQLLPAFGATLAATPPCPPGPGRPWRSTPPTSGNTSIPWRSWSGPRPTTGSGTRPRASS